MCILKAGDFLMHQIIRHLLNVLQGIFVVGGMASIINGFIDVAIISMFAFYFLNFLSSIRCIKKVKCQ